MSTTWMIPLGSWLRKWMTNGWPAGTSSASGMDAMFAAVTMRLTAGPRVGPGTAVGVGATVTLGAAVAAGSNRGSVAIAAMAATTMAITTKTPTDRPGQRMAPSQGE